MYSSEGNFNHTVKTAQDGSTIRLQLYVCPSIPSPTILIVCRLNIEISYKRMKYDYDAATYLFSSTGRSLVPYLWRWLYKATVSTALLKQTVLKSMCSVMQSGQVPASIPSKTRTSCLISLQQSIFFYANCWTMATHTPTIWRQMLI